MMYMPDGWFVMIVTMTMMVNTMVAMTLLLSMMVMMMMVVATMIEMTLVTVMKVAMTVRGSLTYHDLQWRLLQLWH